MVRADLWIAMRQTAKVDAKVESVGTVCMATHSPGSQAGSGQAGDTTWVSVAGQPTHTDSNRMSLRDKPLERWRTAQPQVMYIAAILLILSQIG